jgi:uncharacterized oxidoreductase
MNISGNTILITGGGTGIGRGLAEALQAEGNQVIIAGRRREALEEAIEANPGMKSLTLDSADAGSIRTFAARVTRDFPSLNVLVNNAGIMRIENLPAGTGDVTDAEATINTNLLGPIRLTSALMPVLIQQRKATVMNVSSGLAFVPMAITPTYCATKAAIHSYSQSLRYQLRSTSVEVKELIPPYVATELTGQRQANDPMAMPLDAFIKETMQILKTQPDATEICVERVKPLRFAERSGEYEAFFEKFNDSIAAAMGAH